MSSSGDFGNPLRKFKLVFLGEQSGKYFLHILPLISDQYRQCRRSFRFPKDAVDIEYKNSFFHVSVPVTVLGYLDQYFCSLCSFIVAIEFGVALVVTILI